MLNEPLLPRTVGFYGDDVVAVEQEEGIIYALFVRLCENLGLRREAQVRRIQRHTVLRDGLVTLTIQTPGGPQAAQFLRIDLLPLWLAGIQAERVKAEIRDQLIRYQHEAAQALWQAFRHQILTEDAGAAATSSQTIEQLQQIAEMGRAITAMAEQQIELQRQQQQLAERLNKAGQVVRAMQGEISAVQVRLGVLEDHLYPQALITETQAAEISNVVKALAELLTGKERAKNHYQGIFGELYRRFGVASYKLIRVEQYPSVLAFLEDWRRAGSVAPPEG